MRVWIVCLVLVLGGLLAFSAPTEGAMRVKVELGEHVSTPGTHTFILRYKITLYMPNETILELGVSISLNPDNVTSPTAALAFLKNEAIALATANGMTPAPTGTEVYIFGGLQ